MEYSKSMELSEVSLKSFSEFPSAHLEKLDIASLEKLTLQETAECVGSNCYSNYIEKSSGILGDFSELSGDGGKDVFVKFYSEYVNEPGQLKEDNPEMYNFMRERIFFGREYEIEPLNGENVSEQLSFSGCNKLDIVSVDSKYHSDVYSGSGNLENGGKTQIKLSGMKAHQGKVESELGKKPIF